MKVVIATLTDVPEALHSEYAKQSDGTFRLKVEGDIPELTEYKTKVTEFRDKNIKLMKDAEEQDKKLKTYEGIDPSEHTKMKARLEALEKKGGSDADNDARMRAAVAAETGPLKEQINTERTARETAELKLKRRDLEGKLRTVGTTIKVADSAMKDFLSRGMSVFNLEGVAMDGETSLYSKEKPTELLGMEEWGNLLFVEAPHLFTPSKGGGADPRVGQHGKRTMDGSNPVELGRNLEAIAKGEIIVNQ
jgi:hypothetical protein